MLATGQPVRQPVGKLRQALKCALNRITHDLGGQASGQAIDRLQPCHLVQFVGFGDNVRVYHLHLSMAQFRLAGYQPFLAGRKFAHQVVRSGIEEHQRHGSRGVGHLDPVGQAAASSRFVPLDPHHHGDDIAVGSVADGGDLAAVDHAERQMPEQIDNPFPGGLGDELGQPRSDAFQALNRFKQGI